MSDTQSNVRAPGQAESSKTKVLEAGAAALQDRPPVEAINAYLDGFHFYNGRPNVQMEAHHYCAIVNEDVTQCTIYDGNVKNAKLMGVEYIISAKLFATLPPAEKALWHSHVWEVKSGQLVAPGIPEPAEKELMKKLVGTYGKTWHTWHTDLDKQLPLGVPQLMMGFTGRARRMQRWLPSETSALASTVPSGRRTVRIFPRRRSILQPMVGSGATRFKLLIPREASTLTSPPPRAPGPRRRM
ncbi:OBAP family protein [Ralstonia sp. 1B3]|uniref:OBAP family protein n=1 Tax=Ralstonia sp. 1B3 TaxID=2997421 RepID=UPI002FCC0560